MAGVFKITQSVPTNTNETRPVVAAPAGVQIVRSRQTGDPLPPSGEDAVDHPPEIPWPLAQSLEIPNSKPYKGLR